MNKLATQIVNYIAVSGELLSRQQEKAAAAEAMQKAAAEKATSVLQTLLDTGCVTQGNKKSASQLLSKHATTLDLLANAATKIAELTSQVKKASIELGQPDIATKSAAPVSAASADNAVTNSNYVGRRFRREKTASDVAFLSILNPPKKA